jgi:hypothetical protein
MSRVSTDTTGGGPGAKPAGRGLGVAPPKTPAQRPGPRFPRTGVAGVEVLRRYSNCSGLVRVMVDVGRRMDQNDQTDEPGISTSDGRAEYRTAQRLGEAEVEELVAAYRSGATVRQLAGQFGIHRVTVGRHLAARGIDTHPPALHPDDIPAAADLYRAGWSLARIAEKFDTTDDSVRRRLLEVGVRMRDPQGRER